MPLQVKRRVGPLDPSREKNKSEVQEIVDKVKKIEESSGKVRKQLLERLWEIAGPWLA